MALVGIEGEPTAARTVEVALVNELVKSGAFELVNKREARADDHGGAEYLLRIQVLEFSATEQTGYDEVEVEDSQLKEETGDGKTKRILKAKSMKGTVRCRFDFTTVATNEVRTATTESSETLVANEEKAAIHLPPKLRFLEGLAQKTLHRFFEEYR